MPKDDALMKLMSGDKPDGEPVSGTDATTGPLGAAMTTPQKNEGEQASATSKVALALKLLEQSLPPFGAESKEGGVIMKAVESLTSAFGMKLEEGQKLIPAELKMLMEAANMKSAEMQAAQGAGAAPGAAPPMQKAA